MGEPLLIAKNLTKSYDGKVEALSDVSFTIEPGEFVALIGRSGAGKSTLLRCLNRLVEPTGGSVVFDGMDMGALKGKQLRAARRRMAMIFQHYNLVFRASAIDNVLQGRLGYKSSLTGALSIFSEEEKVKAFEALEQVDMADFAYTRADQLSGGQKQRVGIARALVQEPLIILADEPIASLDPHSSRVVMDHLRRVSKELGIACLVSLHQVEYALEYSDRVICLSHGKFCCGGRPEELSQEVIDSIYEEVHTDGEDPASEDDDGQPGATADSELSRSMYVAAD